MIQIENDALYEFQQFQQHIQLVLRDFQGNNRKDFKKEVLKKITLQYDANFMDFIVVFVIQKLSLSFGIAIYEIKMEETTGALFWKNVQETEAKREKVRRFWRINKKIGEKHYNILFKVLTQ